MCVCVCGVCVCVYVCVCVCVCVCDTVCACVHVNTMLVYLLVCVYYYACVCSTSNIMQYVISLYSFSLSNESRKGRNSSFVLGSLVVSSQIAGFSPVSMPTTGSPILITFPLKVGE